VDFELALKEHKDLYLFEVSKGRVLFRLLDYDSYRSIRYVMKNYLEFKFDLEDRIWNECVIDHTFSFSKDHIEAGIVTTISQIILFYSAPHNVRDINKDLSEARDSLNDAVEQAIITICEAFPSYLPETLEKLPWRVIVKRLAQAERILTKDFEFQDATSQNKDDSGRIFKDLDDFSDRTFDFAKLSREILEA